MIRRLTVRRDRTARAPGRVVVACTLSMLVGTPGLGTAQTVTLVDLSLEELMDVEVTSAARKPQRTGDVAAAVFVITQDDIRRSGATSIPEVLRMAPGIEVARIDANKWAVTARGFNGRFANKLLVLLDGRSVYTRLFSGVYWDTLDTELADIDRIEVIRGPGAAVWGANAVNGVINIITKPATETQGGMATGGIGGEEQGFGSVRYGGRFADGRGHYRVFGKHFNRDSGVEALTGQPAADAWSSSRGGFRLDYASTPIDRLTVHGDVYDGASGETVLLRSTESIQRRPYAGDQEVSGGTLLARWERVSGAASVSLQGYVSRTERMAMLLDETRTTVDLEYQQRRPVGSRHDVVWGGGYRATADDVVGSFSVALDPTSVNDHLASAFLQDEIGLVADRLWLTVGARFDHTNYAGGALQPSARLLWKLHPRHSLWTAASRAARTPSRADRTARLLGLVDLDPRGLPATLPPMPVLTLFKGSDALGSEYVSAFELGYRAQVQEGLGVDVAGFYSDYTDLRSVSFGGPLCEPGGVAVAVNPVCVAFAQYLALPAMFGNDVDATLYGVEVAADWRGPAGVRVQPAYSYLGRADDLPASALESVGNDATGFSPPHQVSLRASVDVGERVEVDGWFRYVDRLTSSQIDGYRSFDARVAWQVLPQLELSMVGQNLFGAQRAEFVSELGDIPPIELQRSAYVQFRWQR